MKRRSVPWRWILSGCVGAALLGAATAGAVVYQVTGEVIPNDSGTTGLLATALTPWEGDPATDPLAINTVVDAETTPEIFLPDLATPVEFRDITEGTGFETTFGWYNVDNPNVLYRVLTCGSEPSPTPYGCGSATACA
ncbi:MAG TPA: hypothetical protein VG389_21610, partial [Myxococcota bacterium]|nr:hypothetical protein [Myxococcota bacterium]